MSSENVPNDPHDLSAQPMRNTAVVFPVVSQQAYHLPLKIVSSANFRNLNRHRRLNTFFTNTNKNLSVMFFGLQASILVQTALQDRQWQELSALLLQAPLKKEAAPEAEVDTV